MLVLLQISVLNKQIYQKNIRVISLFLYQNFYRFSLDDVMWYRLIFLLVFGILWAGYRISF